MFRNFWKLLFPHKSNLKTFHTVRFAFPIVFMAALFASLASVITEEASFITIETDTPVVTRDQIFFIDVNVTAHVPVNAVDLVISYPENRIIIDNIDTGTSVITLWTEEPYAKDGNVYMRGGTFRKGFVGEHTIARIKAHATESGEARFSVKETELVAGDGLGTAVDAEQSSEKNVARIYVSGDDGIISGEIEITFVTDIDGDGEITLKDISAFMSAWFLRDRAYDFNGDGKMNFIDFSIILADSFFK